jgi:hypothetical protein
MAQRIGGIIQVQVDGVVQRAKGDFEFNVGGVERTEVIGSGGEVQGYTEKGIAPYISGQVTDDGTLDIAKLKAVTDATVSLKLANGKLLSLKHGFYAAPGKGTTAESELEVKWIGETMEAVR